MFIFSRTAPVTGLVLLTGVYLIKGCSVNQIQSRMRKCFTISLSNLTNASELDYLSTFCKDLECNIQCYIDAIEDCYKQDRFIMNNPNVFKVTSRAVCSNHNESLSALTQCQWSDTSCLQNFTSASKNAQSLYTANEYQQYKDAYCSALAQLLSCIEFITSDSCTPALADTAENIYIASLSYTTCGIEEHPFFSTYSGDVTCAGITVKWNLFVMSFLMVISFLFVEIISY